MRTAFFRRFPVSLSFLLTVPLLASAGDPGYYRRESTWQDTMLVSQESIAQSGLKDGFPPYESPTLRGGQAPKRIRVDLAGAHELYLFVTGCPDMRWPVGNWAEPVLVRRDGSRQSVTATNAFRVLRGRYELNMTLRAGLYDQIRMGGTVYSNGINVQAQSVIQVPLGGEFDHFEAVIGVDDWAGTNGTLRFSVVGARTAAAKRLYELVTRDFQDAGERRQIEWEREDRVFEFSWDPQDWRALAIRYAAAASRVPEFEAEATRASASVASKRDLEKVRALYYRSRELEAARLNAAQFNVAGLRAALQDLEGTPDFPRSFRTRFEALTVELGRVLEGKPSKPATLERIAVLEASLQQLKSEALLANPLLKFDRLMMVKRKPIGDPRRAEWEGFGFGEYLGVPRQSSWNNGTMPNVDQWTNEIAVLSPVKSAAALSTLFRPDSSVLVADLELDWEASKLLFSMPDKNRNWQVCEIRADGTGFRQLTPSHHPDVHNYDALYLPSGEILFLSTAPLQGVPCNASVIVGMMYKMGPNGESIRQLTFEQDHDYTPAVLNSGRVLYLRWDYTDTPHIWNRLLMSMNPDGTGQMEFYGANSYWPNAIFFARPIPNHPTKVVGIVTGHHEGRVGELFILDPAKGRHETNGIVQRIPQAGPPIEPKIEDKLTEHSWPKFLHPWPLSDKYFLVSCKPNPGALWGIYLADVFDNLVLLKEEPGYALLEPMPMAARPKPPVIQDRTIPASKEAVVYMEDIYSGPGLRGIPRGTVKRLRLFTYHFGYQRLAGIDHRVGADGPWEIKRVLGTVPVEADGSALFTIPAKMPISIQPLDEEGKAVALMRSWLSAMPGESVSCVGCHDQQSSAPPSNQKRLALQRIPSRITPWRGPVRGFSFSGEVQPVLDKFCVGCHDGKQSDRPDLRRDQGHYVVYRGGQIDGQRIHGVKKEELLGKYGAVFDPSYVALRQYVRVGGLESDLHLLNPKEFHADTSELVQMLRKGHHGVKLDAEAWERLVTWIDLNAPCHGRWGDVTKIPGNQCQRRLELRKLYGGVVEDCEAIEESESDYDLPDPIVPPAPAAEKVRPPVLDGWPLTAAQAQALQRKLGLTTRRLDLGDGIEVSLVHIPAGRFVMGDADGAPDEQPPSVVTIEKSFWMSDKEISNEQYARFDRAHDSRFEHRTSWIFSEEYLGWRLNQPRQPVVRVSWRQAVEFCQWLSEKSGLKVRLPSEAQWEYACRAGTDSALSYGGVGDDFSSCANLGDISLRRLADEGWRPKSPDLIPREGRFNDGALVTSAVGSYQPNAWGLFDMHGNAAEWTLSSYTPRPSSEPATLDPRSAAEPKVVRGGSWRDRPKLCRSASRLAYSGYQKVFNVGFRIIVED
jgi:formylglycine-generating enzyme required for sulfatase activity